jgi:hypothetical protein
VTSDTFLPAGEPGYAGSTRADGLAWWYTSMSVETRRVAVASGSPVPVLRA